MRVWYKQSWNGGRALLVIESFLYIFTPSRELLNKGIDQVTSHELPLSYTRERQNCWTMTSFRSRDLHTCWRHSGELSEFNRNCIRRNRKTVRYIGLCIPFLDCATFPLLKGIILFHFGPIIMHVCLVGICRIFYKFYTDVRDKEMLHLARNFNFGGTPVPGKSSLPRQR